MRPTSRGLGLAIALAAVYVLAWQVGQGTLNAVLVPLLVVLVVGAVDTWRVDRPTVRREPIAAGSVGAARTVGIEIETDASVAATVRDVVGDGLERPGTAGDPRIETTLEGTDRVAYDLRLAERGERRLGPVTIAVTDLFGLFERRFTLEETTTVLVYPRVRSVRSGPDRAVRTAVAGPEPERTAFDHLREYRRGDSLRDVHWKSAAKRPDDDLVVTEYADEQERPTATLAAECGPGRDDELATAVASVALYLLEDGVDVGLSLPAGALAPGSGDDHRRELLAELAVLEAGELAESTRRDADAVIRADTDGTRLLLADRTIPFERLVGERRDEPADAQSRTSARDDDPGVVA